MKKILSSKITGVEVPRFKAKDEVLAFLTTL